MTQLRGSERFGAGAKKEGYARVTAPRVGRRPNPPGNGFSPPRRREGTVKGVARLAPKSPWVAQVGPPRGFPATAHPVVGALASWHCERDVRVSWIVGRVPRALAKCRSRARNSLRARRRADVAIIAIVALVAMIVESALPREDADEASGQEELV
jgi:hypothetical protein